MTIPCSLASLGRAGAPVVALPLKQTSPAYRIGYVARSCRIYFYHCALLAIAFTLAARVALTFHRVAFENLLSFDLQSPKQALIAAALLQYRPSLMDILPMYIVFMLLTPIARKIAQMLGWKSSMPSPYNCYTMDHLSQLVAEKSGPTVLDRAPVER
jgi:hypothetical protein